MGSVADRDFSVDMSPDLKSSGGDLQFPSFDIGLNVRTSPPGALPHYSKVTSMKICTSSVAN